MIQINNSSAQIRKPDSVRFGEWAIAAGLVGQPIAVCFTESLATVDCELWRYFSELAGQSHVLQVHSQSDVRKLTKTFDHWRLVIVHVPRLYNTVAWTVQTHDSETTARPSMFSRIVPDSADDVPIPLLVLRITPDESSLIVRWLMADCPHGVVLPHEQLTNGIVYDSVLSSVMMPKQLPNGLGPAKLRDCKLLAALLCGTCLTRAAEQSNEVTIPRICGQHEYERVRRLLQSSLLAASDGPVNQLAVDMIGRANVFLELKCNRELTIDNPLSLTEADPTWWIRGSLTRKELTTRSEVADLGNLRSRLIHEIVEVLQTIPNGYGMFRRMGLVRQPPSEREFKPGNSRTLVRMLRSWSSKQVRTYPSVPR